MTVRVLQVVTQLERAGAQTVAFWLQTTLTTSCSISTRFLYDKSGSDLFDEASCLQSRRPKSVSEFAGLIRGLRNSLREGHDVVLAHTHYAIALTALVSMSLLRRPRIVAVHHWPISRYPMWVRSLWRICGLLRIVESDIHVSRSTVERGSPIVIPNPVPRPVDSSVEAQLGEVEEIDLLIVARHSREKSIETALRAVAMTEDRHLTLIGSGPETESLVELAAYLRIQGRVSFLGNVSNSVARRYMRASNVLLLTSLWEAMPMVLLEGVSEGVNMIVTDIPAHTFLIESGAALGVEKLAPQALAEAIRSVDSPEIERRLALGREQVLDKQSESHIAALWLEVLTR